MKNKKLFLPTIILASAIVLTMIATLITSIALKPKVTEYEFPFSITYELDGKKTTINDVYKAWYKTDNAKERYYAGEIGNMGEDTTHYTLKSSKKSRIELHTQFYADYMMGDAEYDYFDTFEPIIYYYDSNETESSDPEFLAEKGAKLIDFEYPTPIENSLKFSHIAFPDSYVIIPAIIIAFLAMLATIIFVKKDIAYENKPINTISTILNFVIAITTLPYFSICAFLLDALGDAGDFLNLLFYFLPAITILSITASIALRRKLYAKTALIVEFLSPAIFAIIMFVGACLGLV